MDLSSVNKHTPRNLAISAVFFSCFGGMKIGWGIQQLAAQPVYPMSGWNLNKAYSGLKQKLSEIDSQAAMDL